MKRTKRKVVTTKAVWWNKSVAVFVHDVQVITLVHRALVPFRDVTLRPTPVEKLLHGQLAVLFVFDNWYRVRVERVFGNYASVTLIDVGRFLEMVDKCKLMDIGVICPTVAYSPPVQVRTLNEANLNRFRISEPELLSQQSIKENICKIVWTEEIQPADDDDDDNSNAMSGLQQKSYDTVHLTSSNGKSFPQCLESLIEPCPASDESTSVLLLLSDLDLRPTEIVSVLRVEGSELGVQLTRYPIEELRRLECELAVAAEHKQLRKPKRLKVFDVVAVNWNNKLARGYVVDCGPVRVEVFLADYGFSVTRAKSNIWHLPLGHANRLPSYGFQLQVRKTVPPISAQNPCLLLTSIEIDKKTRVVTADASTIGMADGRNEPAASAVSQGHDDNRQDVIAPDLKSNPGILADREQDNNQLTNADFAENKIDPRLPLNKMSQCENAASDSTNSFDDTLEMTAADDAEARTSAESTQTVNGGQKVDDLFHDDIAAENSRITSESSSNNGLSSSKSPRGRSDTSDSSLLHETTSGFVSVERHNGCSTLNGIEPNEEMSTSSRSDFASATISNDERVNDKDDERENGANNERDKGANDKDDERDKGINTESDKGANDERDKGVNDERDKGVNDERDKGVNDERDEGVNDERDKGVNDERDKGVNDESDKGVNDERDKGVNDERDKGVNDERDKGVNDERDKAANDERDKAANDKDERDNGANDERDRGANDDNDNHRLDPVEEEELAVASDSNQFAALSELCDVPPNFDGNDFLSPSDDLITDLEKDLIQLDKKSLCRKRVAKPSAYETGSRIRIEQNSGHVVKNDQARLEQQHVVKVQADRDSVHSSSETISLTAGSGENLEAMQEISDGRQQPEVAEHCGYHVAVREEERTDKTIVKSIAEVESTCVGNESLHSPLSSRRNSLPRNDICAEKCQIEKHFSNITLLVESICSKERFVGIDISSRNQIAETLSKLPTESLQRISLSKLRMFTKVLVPFANKLLRAEVFEIRRNNATVDFLDAYGVLPTAELYELPKELGEIPAAKFNALLQQPAQTTLLKGTELIVKVAELRRGGDLHILEHCLSETNELVSDMALITNRSASGDNPPSQNSFSK